MPDMTPILLHWERTPGVHKLTELWLHPRNIVVHYDDNERGTVVVTVPNNCWYPIRETAAEISVMLGYDRLSLPNKKGRKYEKHNANARR